VNIRPRGKRRVWSDGCKHPHGNKKESPSATPRRLRTEGKLQVSSGIKPAMLEPAVRHRLFVQTPTQLDPRPAAKRTATSRDTENVYHAVSAHRSIGSTVQIRPFANKQTTDNTKQQSPFHFNSNDERTNERTNEQTNKRTNKPPSSQRTPRTSSFVSDCFVTVHSVFTLVLHLSLGVE